MNVEDEIKVEMMPYELTLAHDAAKRRQQNSKERKLDDRRGYYATPQQDLENGINANLAELALAKILNVYCPLAYGVGGIGDMKFKGRSLDVKHSCNGKCMLIEPPMFCEEKIYVSVTGNYRQSPMFYIRGFATGKAIEPHIDEWLTDFRKADRPLVIAVPPSGINPFPATYQLN